jgi:DAD family
MGYLDNFDNGLLNKYKKNLKNEKKIIDVFSTFILMFIQILYNFIIIW